MRRAVSACLVLSAILTACARPTTSETRTPKLTATSPQFNVRPVNWDMPIHGLQTSLSGAISILPFKVRVPQGLASLSRSS